MPRGAENFRRFVERRVNGVGRRSLRNLQSPPPLGTPVDTGMARDSWKFTPIRRGGSVATLISDVPYMGRLNRGHSAQSPIMFIQRAVRRAINAEARSGAR